MHEETSSLRKVSWGTTYIKNVIIFVISPFNILLLLQLHFNGFSSLWCSGYHCCTTSFNKAGTQVLRGFKSCSRLVGDSRW